MARELSKQYDPKEVEERIYKMWLNGRYFHAKCEENKPTYTIVIPPPNITGQLHMGARHGPRINCDRGENCRKNAAGGAYQGGRRQRRLFGARLGMEKAVRRQNYRAA